ncbi:nicotinate-nucleotide diphosphorylase [Lactarius hatsudake]|nr:nicotinate-nucleotide diphosphorylase [Lactarius hatsudake]
MTKPTERRLLIRIYFRPPGNPRFVVGEDHREAFLWGKGSKCAVLAGTPFVDEIFRLLDCTVDWHVAEGDMFEPMKHVATVHGKTLYLLLGERIALNLFARCSGIATASKRTKDLADSYGFRGVVAGTRKTTPGFRLVEKYGMIVGGIDPHRFDLSSMIMLKDNHIWSADSKSDFPRTRSWGLGFSLLDVEVRDEEANEAIASGADVIILDNIEGDELVSVARRLCDRWAGEGKKFLLETRGGHHRRQPARTSNQRWVDLLSAPSNRSHHKQGSIF